MDDFKILIGIALLIWYLYSSFKSNDSDKKKKTMDNPTPGTGGGLEDLVDRMIREQQKKMEEKKLREVKVPDPKDKQRVQTKIKTTSNKGAPERQFLPFEKRKSTEPREMPSVKQISRVTQREKKAIETARVIKVTEREKKAQETTRIEVKDYDENFVNHDEPHAEHHLSDDSKIKFDFGHHIEVLDEFDLRKAIIYQTILERKEY